MLVCTDIASRGLDTVRVSCITDILSVIDFFGILQTGLSRLLSSDSVFKKLYVWTA